MCIFREFNKLILPGIKFSVLIRNMAPPPKVSGVGGGGGGGICPKCPILDPPLVSIVAELGEYYYYYYYYWGYR